MGKKKKRLENCRTGKQLLKYAKRQGCDIRSGKGSHMVVSYKDFGSMVIPVHANKQLGRGLLRVIVKWFIYAGLAIFLILVVLP